MPGSYKIGSVWGIGIELHWTFIALLLVTFVLSLPSGFLFIIIVLLFVCVLIHELAHSYVALRNKVRVKRIVLLPLGGASMIEQTTMPPGLEFNIAVAGPLMSVLLGSLFGFIVVFAPAGITTELFQFLFEINVLLGVFNLLPAFPTDGGRVFRSYLQRRYDSYKATMLTIRAGNIVMALFMVFTLVYVILISSPVFYKEFIFLWDLLIVFFLYSGSQAEKEAVELKRYTKGISLSRVVSENFVEVKPDARLEELYDEVRESKEHMFITRLGGSYAFVDLFKKERLRSGDVTASQLATKIPEIKISTELVDALSILESGGIGVAAVVSRGKLVGIVTLSHMQVFLSLHVLQCRGHGENKPSANR